MILARHAARRRTGMLTEAELRDLVAQRRDRHRADGVSRPLRAAGRQALRRRLLLRPRCSAHGMHACDYLLACDMEMDPVPGLPLHLVGEGLRRRALRARPRHPAPRRLARAHRAGAVRRPRRAERARWSTSRRAPSSSASSSAPPPPATCRWAPRSWSSSSCARRYEQAHAKGFDRLTTAGWFIEDYHTLQGSKVEPLVGAIRRALKASGVPVESSKGEWGPGQQELNLQYAPLPRDVPTATSSTSRPPRRSPSSRAAR